MGCIALHVLPMNPATPVRCWNAVAKGALTEAKLVVVALQAGWDTALRLDEVTIRLINEQYRSPAMFLGDVRKKIWLPVLTQFLLVNERKLRKL